MVRRCLKQQRFHLSPNATYDEDVLAGVDSIFQARVAATAGNARSLNMVRRVVSVTSVDVDPERRSK